MFKKNWGPIKLAGVDKQKMTERTVIKDIYKKKPKEILELRLKNIPLRKKWTLKKIEGREDQKWHRGESLKQKLKP